MKIIEIPQIRNVMCDRCYTLVSLEHKDLDYKNHYNTFHNADCYWKCPVCKRFNTLSKVEFYFSNKKVKNEK